MTIPHDVISLDIEDSFMNMLQGAPIDHQSSHHSHQLLQLNDNNNNKNTSHMIPVKEEDDLTDLLHHIDSTEQSTDSVSPQHHHQHHQHHVQAQQQSMIAHHHHQQQQQQQQQVSHHLHGGGLYLNTRVDIQEPGFMLISCQMQNSIFKGLMLPVHALEHLLTTGTLDMETLNALRAYAYTQAMIYAQSPPIATAASATFQTIPQHAPQQIIVPDTPMNVPTTIDNLYLDEQMMMQSVPHQQQQPMMQQTTSPSQQTQVIQQPQQEQQLSPQQPQQMEPPALKTELKKVDSLEQLEKKKKKKIGKRKYVKSGLYRKDRNGNFIFSSSDRARLVTIITDPEPSTPTTQPQVQIPIPQVVACPSIPASPQTPQSAQTFTQTPEFLLFCREQRSLLNGFDDSSPEVVDQLLVEQWKVLPVTERRRYQKLSQKEPAQESNNADASNGQRIKRPLNAYNIFCKMHFEEVKAKNPNMSINELSKLIGEKWKNMTDQQKKKYYDMVEHGQPRYKKPLNSYNLFCKNNFEALKKQYPNHSINVLR
jgi:hypothetical protein